MEHDIKKLLNILDKSKYESYEDWYELGSILYNIDTNLLRDFEEFTVGCHNDQESKRKNCKEIWTHNLKDTQKSHALCLPKLATMDNIFKYRSYVMEYIVEKYNLKNSTTISRDTINDIVYDLYGDVCMYVEGNWYNYIVNKWVLCDATQIYHVIYHGTSTILDMVSDKYILDKKSATKDISEINIYFKRERFEKKKGFDEIFDTNTSLIGFNNGVYDLKRKYFRVGYPGDYIFKSTRYSYVEYSHDHKKVKELLELLKPVKNEKELQDFFEYAESCLTGRKRSIDVWHGKLGKSCLAKLLSSSLGEYAYVGNNIFGNEKEFKLGHIENLTKGCRLIISENNQDIRLNYLKNFTTGSYYMQSLIEINNLLKPSRQLKQYMSKMGASDEEIDKLSKKRDNKYYENIFADNPYGKSIYNPAGKYLINRDLYGSYTLFPTSHNVLMIDFKPDYDTESFNRTEFKLEFEVDPNICDEIYMYKQVFMWMILNMHKKDHDVNAICKIMNDIKLY